MSENKSKFSALLRSRKEETTPEAEPQAPATAQKSQPRPKSATAASGAGDAAAKRPRGRPKANGKRLNPEYTQVTAYIPAGLHTETKINLIRSGKREFSILIEELLTSWNKKHGTEQTA